MLLKGDLPQIMLRRILFLAVIAISLSLVWFAVDNYRASIPIAGENLQGLALSLETAIESLAVRDPTFQTLAEFHPPDIAFLAIIDRQGVYRFHSNADLIGTTVENDKYRDVFVSKSISSARITLGTGERAYEFYAPLYLGKKTYVLRLVLHTYRSDAVIRRARFNMVILLGLLAAGWLLGLVLYRFAVREERHQVEMARRERLAQIGEMGAMLAHEIRNPLAGIKGYAQIIEKKPCEERNAGFARRMVAEVQRLERLVSDLLAYSRGDHASMSPVDVGELVANTVSLVRCEAEQQNVSISGKSAGRIRVTGNRDRLGQVLINLAKNALQAMPEGGNLDITADVSRRNVIITVKDSGHGISPADLPRIFEPFFTTKARGTGLGLALCRKTVEEHGGEIRVASEEGKGTSVSIILPRIKSGERRGNRS
jgi:two-component system sensor histidine kinase HydH